MTKVMDYMRNVGKSIVYSNADRVAEYNTTSAEFLETNSELFKSIYTSVRDYKTTINRMSNIFKNSKIYTATDIGITAIKEDIKTGKFYNKERKDAIDLKYDLGMGEDDEDFNFDFDFSNDSSKSPKNLNLSSTPKKI